MMNGVRCLLYSNFTVLLSRRQEDSLVGGRYV